FNPTSDDNPQTTGELRATSPSLAGFLGLERLFGLGLGSTDLTLGFFYQDRGIDDDVVNLAFNLPVVAQFAAYNALPPGTPIGGLEEFTGVNVPIGELGVFDTSAGVAATTMLFNQTTRSIAGFAQMDWRVVERWTLQYGMRLTDERKEADWNRTVTQVTGTALAALGAEEFTANRSRSELAFTPKASLRYDWSDDISAYAFWAQGFKAGGFNAQAFNDNSADALQYAPEKATAWELGARMWLLGGTANVNLALFRETIEDLQVLTVPPNSVDTSVVNAGEARAQGVELDSTWVPASWLTLTGTLAFNDSEFIDFPLGQCSFDRPDTDGSGDGQCDLTGEPLFRTPKWMSTLVGNLRFPLADVASLAGSPLFADGIDLIGGGTFQYQDVQYLDRAADERGRQSSFFRFGANVGLGSLTRGWSARVVVENLTDADTAYLIRDVALGEGIFIRIPEPGRLVFGSFRWAF
ncbi:MAG: TonB-dependent receptor, partial [Candidatus Binatia bacterium]